MAHEHSAPDDVTSEATWDERYASSDKVWSGEPNEQLVTEVVGLDAGTALDLGCGEGADAVWLAQQGWRVTAVDISTVALQRAAAHARQVLDAAGDRIEWVHQDVLTWAPPAASYDLVTVHFMQLPEQQRLDVHRRLAAAVAPGGALLIVAHSPLDLETTVKRPPSPELYFTATQVADALEPREWEIVKAEARPRPVTDPEGRSIHVYDEVLHARRRR